MIQFSLAKTRRRALYLSAAFAASAFLTMGLSGTAMAVPTPYPDTTGNTTITWWNDGVSGWVNGTTAGGDAAFNQLFGDLDADSYGYGKNFVLDTTYQVGAAGGGEIYLGMGDTGSATTSSADYSIGSLTFAGSDLAIADDDAIFDWMAGTLTINGNVSIDSAGRPGSGTAYFWVGTDDAAMGTTMLTDTVVNVGGSIINFNPSSMTGGGWLDLSPATLGNMVVEIGAWEYGDAATVLNVAGSVILMNNDPDSDLNESYVYLDSTNNDATLNVGGNLGYVNPLFHDYPPAELAWVDDVLGAFFPPEIFFDNTPVWVNVGAGAPLSATTTEPARNFDATIDVGGSIYVSDLDTWFDTDLYTNTSVADYAAPDANGVDVQNHVSNEVLGNVSYTAAGDFYAANVSVGLGWNYYYDAVADLDVPVAYSGGGNVSYSAGNDMWLRIVDNAHNLGTTDRTLIDDTTIVEGANHYGSFTYEAGRDLYINYTGLVILDIPLVGNTPVGHYSFQGHDTVATDLTYHAGHDIYIGANYFGVAGVGVGVLEYRMNTGGGALSVVSESGNITFSATTFYADAGTGGVYISANEIGSATHSGTDSYPGNITFTGRVEGLVSGLGDIVIYGSNYDRSSIMTVGAGDLASPVLQGLAGFIGVDMLSLAIDDYAGPTVTSTGDILIDVDNLIVYGGIEAYAGSYADGSIIITAVDSGRTPVQEALAAGMTIIPEWLGDILPDDILPGVFAVNADVDRLASAFTAKYRYGFDPIYGSIVAADGIYLDASATGTGEVSITTDNLFNYGDLSLDGEGAVLNVADWAFLGGDAERLYWGIADAADTHDAWDYNFNRVALVGDVNGLLSALFPFDVEGNLTTVTWYASTNHVDARVTADQYFFVPETSMPWLYTTVNDLAVTDFQNYEQRISDGSLYIGTVPTFDATGDWTNPLDSDYVSSTAVNATTGFWAPTLILGAGLYGYDSATGSFGHHTFDPTVLTIGDRLYMTDNGKIDMYDGSSIYFAYGDIEALTDQGYTKVNGGQGNGHFALASNINMSGINYYFTDARTLITESDNDGDTMATWNQPYHNVVIAMDDPNEYYDNPTDNLETIGWRAEEFSTNLDDSPFFNISYGWLDGEAYTADEKYAFGITEVTWKATSGVQHTLENQAPTWALGDMAGILKDWQWDYTSDSNNIVNLLYLSPSLGQYQRDLTTISAGSNLNAAYMVSHHVHKMAIDRAGEYNRLVASVACPPIGDAPATGYENATAMNGLWINPYYQYKEMDDDFGNGVLGYDITSWGFVGGYDREIVEQFRVGFYFGATQPKLEDNNGGNIDGKDFQLGVYGSWHDPNLFEVNMGLGFGWQDYEADRNVMISRDGNAPYYERLWADYDGDSFDFNLEIAKPIFLENNIWLRPAVGYNYQKTSLDGFSENSHSWAGGSGVGGESLAQNVDDTDLDQHFFRLGLSAGWDSDMVGISGKLFWVGRSGDDRPESSSYFMAGPLGANGTYGSDHFRIEGAESDDSSINLGLNVNAYLNEDKTATFNVGFETLLGSDEQAYIVNVGLSYQF